MEVDFENCGEIISPSIAAGTHARVPYSSPVLMVIHFELVRLEKMSRTLEKLVEMMSPICFAFFHKRLPNAFLAQFFLNWMKGYVESDVERIVN